MEVRKELQTLRAISYLAFLGEQGLGYALAIEMV